MTISIEKLQSCEFSSFVSILLSRFILDLHSIYLIDKSSYQTTSRSTTIQFAPNIEGNLGASLDISWVTGQERDFEEDEKIQYSDNPFATGLFGFKEDSRIGQTVGNDIDVLDIR